MNTQCWRKVHFSVYILCIKQLNSPKFYRHINPWITLTEFPITHALAASPSALRITLSRKNYLHRENDCRKTDTTRQTIKISGVVQSRAGRFENCILASARIVSLTRIRGESLSLLFYLQISGISRIETRIVSHSPFYRSRRDL